MSKNEKILGQVQIANEVIESIASIAAMEVNGVYGMAGNVTGDLMKLIGVKNLAKGVKVDLEEGKVKLDVFIIIKYGYEIPKVANELQNKIKTEVETMSGLEVTTVNINIAGVFATGVK
ncbi:MAG TPA: Asp23/Gls24 family envelope stress response protein [Clostridiales bacterium]|nr:Asp23/Gls24 family envelope stress response protein [Clostridiales bacterium]